MEKEKNGRVLAIGGPLVILLISLLLFARLASSPDTYKKTIQSLDRKRTTVIELTAASTAASTAITLLPGDAATPVADKLADLSGYFLIVLCAVFLEKYLLPIAGMAAFGILIPAACLCAFLFALQKKTFLKTLSLKLSVFGLALFLVIPASVKISDMIEHTYEASIESTIYSAKQATVEIEEKEASGVLDKLTELTDSLASIPDRVQNVLNQFLEALAVMIVTSCVIPIVVMLFFIWIVKLFLGVGAPMPPHRLPPVHDRGR